MFFKVIKVYNVYIFISLRNIKDFLVFDIMKGT